jgi:alanine racemase
MTNCRGFGRRRRRGIGDKRLVGRQGKEEITLTELADLAGTINYELACAISSRVPRLYLNE